MSDVEALPKASPKTEDKEEQEKTGDGKKGEKLVLTPSEEALGIRITQPEQKTMDIMMRLYAVPSEKLRVWTCWLIKVGERADDWQWWLRAYIGLALKISDHLQQAALILEMETKGKEKLGQEVGGVSDVADVPEEQPVGEVSEADSTDIELKSSIEEETVTKEVPVESKETVVPEGEPEDAQQPVEVSEAEGSQGKGDKTKGKPGEKTKAEKLEAKIMYKEGFWPIGVRWKPLSQRSKWKPPPHREPDDIPVPGNQKEMIELIGKIKHQGVVYRSLYKHWSETAGQAVKEIVGRDVLPTKQVYSKGEEVPYFFYLKAEPDIDYVIEDDDEEVLLPDPGREKITHEFTHLYFNLSDKPGKGGKPWI